MTMMITRQRLWVVAGGMWVLSGCATVSTPPEKPVATAVETSPGILPQASLGMRREDVLPLLTRSATVGYEKDAATGEFRPVRAGALYSTEVVVVNGITYQVDSYVVGDIKAEGAQAHNLLPLIYQKGILVGKGQSELEALKARGQ